MLFPFTSTADFTRAYVEAQGEDTKNEQFSRRTLFIEIDPQCQDCSCPGRLVFIDCARMTAFPESGSAGCTESDYGTAIAQQVPTHDFPIESV
jgi:hypothetical protein